MEKRLLLGYGVSGNMSALGAVDVGSNPATLIQLKLVKLNSKQAKRTALINLYFKLYLVIMRKVLFLLAIKIVKLLQHSSRSYRTTHSFLANPFFKAAVVVKNPCSLMDKALPFECKDMCSTHVRSTSAINIIRILRKPTLY